MNGGARVCGRPHNGGAVSRQPPSIAELQWTVTAFMIPFSALLITAGRLADIFGRVRILLIGTLLFAAGSVLATVSPDIVLLIAGIALAGTGGALLMPSSMSILTNVFTGSSRGFAIGLWGAATELISGVGVLVGGVLTGLLDWRWIFIVCVAVAVLIAVLAIQASPESRDPTVPREVDVAGVLLSAGALTATTRERRRSSSSWTSRSARCCSFSRCTSRRSSTTRRRRSGSCCCPSPA
jgi:MFS family permease